MNEDKADQAHEVLEAYQAAIIAVGAAMLRHLDDEQRQYVIDKCHDEFRFWRVRDALGVTQTDAAYCAHAGHHRRI